VNSNDHRQKTQKSATLRDGKTDKLRSKAGSRNMAKSAEIGSHNEKEKKLHERGGGRVGGGGRASEEKAKQNLESWGIRCSQEMPAPEAWARGS